MLYVWLVNAYDCPSPMSAPCFVLLAPLRSNTLRHKALIASLVPLLATSIAFASNWTQLATFTDGTRFLVDTTSSSSAGQYRKGWFKFVSIQAADLPDGAIPNPAVPPGQGFTYIVELFYAKCAQRKTAMIQGSLYGADDSLLGTIPAVVVRNSEFEEAPPGSLGDKIVRTLCKGD